MYPELICCTIAAHQQSSLCAMRNGKGSKIKDRSKSKLSAEVLNTAAQLASRATPILSGWRKIKSNIQPTDFKSVNQKSMVSTVSQIFS
jgi:hypothetical protein